jgi:hypothetical protein
VPPTATSRLLRELGVDYEAVVRHIEEEGARRMAAEDWRAEEHRLEGWEEFRVTDQQDEVIRGRFHAVNKELRGRGVRFMFGKRDDNPTGQWCGSILVDRVWTPVGCSTASSATRRDHGPHPPLLIVLSWSVLGPHGSRNRWFSAGRSGHGRRMRIAGI